MTIFGTNNVVSQSLATYLLSLVFLVSTNALTAQVDRFCNDNTCGDLEPNWELSGQSVVCEGTDFRLSPATSSPLERIESFHWFIEDLMTNEVIFDTLFNDPSLLTYNFSLSDSLACTLADSRVTLIVRLVVQSQTCENDQRSCRFATKPLTVNLKPRANFSVQNEVCIDEDINLQNTGCHGDSYLWEFGDGTTSTDENPSKVFDQPGVYNIRLQSINSCGRDTFTRRVEVVGLPEADFNIINESDNFCLPLSLSFQNSSNAFSNTRWEISPNNPSRWMFTDTLMNTSSKDISIRFLQTGDYTIGLRASNTCIDDDFKEELITIFDPPEIQLLDSIFYCDEATISSSDLDFQIDGDFESITWFFENASISTTTGSTFSGVNFNQNGRAIAEIQGPCGILRDTSNIVIAVTDAITLAPSNPEQWCQNAGNIELNALPAGGRWQGPGGISTQGILNPENLSPGLYEFTYNAGSPACPNMASLDLEILAPASVNLRPIDPVCETLTFTPNVRYQGEIDTYRWSFPGGNPSSSDLAQPSNIDFSQPDSILVSIEVSGVCGPAKDSINIQIQADQPLSIEPVNQPICNSSDPIQLLVNQAGGRWQGSGVDQSGIFDPTTVAPDQTYTIRYELQEGACLGSAEIDLRVVSSATVTVPDAILCIDSSPTALMASPAGGIWSGSIAIDSTTGVFDPQSSGVGDFNINYAFTDNNSCTVNKTAVVTVRALPVIQTNGASIEVCLADFSSNLPELLDFAVVPSEGQTIWIGDGIIDGSQGLFNPRASGLETGTFMITVTHQRDDCLVSETVSVNVIDAPVLELSPDTSICISENTLQLTSNVSGGRWSGPGIDQNGQIDLFSAGGGTFTYTYTFGAGSSCAQSATTRVNVIDLASAIDTGPLQSICFGPATTNLSGATPTNGFWRGPAVLDAQTGLVDLSQLTVDSVYTFEYCLESNIVGNCEACKPKSFILRSNPIADFEVREGACIFRTISFANRSIGGQNYSWDFGNGNTSSQFNPTNNYEASETYTVSLEVTSAFGCQSRISQDLYVSAPPTVSFSLAEDEGCAPFEIVVNNRSSGDSIRQRWLIGQDTILGANLDNYFVDSITEDTRLGVILEVENFCGTISQTDSILVRPYPSVSFGISEDEGCSPLEIDLINNTLGNPDDFRWDFGNGMQSTDLEPLSPLFYADRDTIEQFDIQLTASNECGVDSLSKRVTVFPPDVEAFIELDTLSACQGFEFQLKSESTPGAATSWQIIDPFGRATGRAEEDPIVNLRDHGLYTFILSASNCGTDTDTAQVEVLQRPNLSVSVLKTPFPCVGQSIQFNNRANPDVISGSIWDFGDGQTSTEYSPQHQYQEPGTYTYSVTVYSIANNCPNNLTSNVTIVDNPVVEFSADQTEGCGPLLVNFSNLSADKEALSFIWDFGDGSSQVFEEAPSHQFDQPGNYQVALTAYTRDSCFADTKMMNIRVFPDPVSNFTLESDLNCAGKDSLRIRNLSQNAVAFEWNINGMLNEDTLPQVFLDQTGDIPIELIVQNVFQCRDTSRQILRVLPSPNAAFVVDDSIGCQDFNVQFQQESRDADRYLWNFDNGNSSIDLSPSQVFREPGIYTVQLVAQNSNGCPADTAQIAIEVLPKPTAAFSFDKPAECGTPAEVVFTNESIGNQDNFWTFGDGTSSDETNPAYFYVNFGPKQVSLMVSSDLGCQDTTTQMLDIFGLPQANFDFSTGSACTSDSIQLINTSQEAIEFIWQIDELPFSKERSLSIVYDRAGTYPIQLIAVYNEACQDTIQKDLLVYQKPTADFSYQADFDPAILGEVQFTNQSVFANRYLWDLGDGTVTDRTDVYHEYLVNRSLDVELIAFNDNSGSFTCTDTIVRPVEPEWLATFYAPNALAPDLDNDGVRFFKPVGTGLKIYEIQVYSPWGTIVWESTSLEDGQPTGRWDGTYEGEKLPQGAYVWVATMTFEDGNEQRRSGTVTIIR